MSGGCDNDNWPRIHAEEERKEAATKKRAVTVLRLSKAVLTLTEEVSELEKTLGQKRRALVSAEDALNKELGDVPWKNAPNTLLLERNFRGRVRVRADAISTSRCDRCGGESPRLAWSLFRCQT